MWPSCVGQAMRPFIYSDSDPASRVAALFTVVGSARVVDLETDPLVFLPWELTLGLRTEPVLVLGLTECCPWAPEAREAIEECEDDSDNSTSLARERVEPPRWARAHSAPRVTSAALICVNGKQGDVKSSVFVCGWQKKSKALNHN